MLLGRVCSLHSTSIPTTPECWSSPILLLSLFVNAVLFLHLMDSPILFHISPWKSLGLWPLLSLKPGGISKACFSHSTYLECLPPWQSTAYFLLPTNPHLAFRIPLEALWPSRMPNGTSLDHSTYFNILCLWLYFYSFHLLKGLLRARVLSLTYFLILSILPRIGLQLIFV